MAQRNQSKFVTSGGAEADDPIEQGPRYAMDADERQFVDNQILGVQRHIIAHPSGGGGTPGGASGDIEYNNAGAFGGIGGAAGVIIRRNVGGTAWQTEAPLELPAGAAAGDLFYYSGTVLVRVPIGTAGKVLAVTGGIPAWTTAAAGTPGGASGSVQINNAGVFGGVAPNTSGNVLTSNGSAWVSSAPSGAGFTAPTGTGLMVTTSGTMDTASRLLVDADVGAAAAIDGTKISPNFGSQIVQTSNNMTAASYSLGGAASISTGAGVPASAPSNGSVYLRNDGTSATGIYTRQGGAWSAVGGGGLTSTSVTGTGFWRSASGTLNSAAQKVDLTAAADVTVPATVNGVVTTSGTVLQQAANVLAGSSYVSSGATPAASGEFRLPNAGSGVRFRDVGNTGDMVALAATAGNKLIIGSATDYVTSPFGKVDVSATGGFEVAPSGNSKFLVDSTAVQAAVPIIGYGTVYGVHGCARITTGSGNYTVSSSEVGMNVLIVDSTAWGTKKKIYLPLPTTDAQAYRKVVWAKTGYDVIVSLGSGREIEIPYPFAREIFVDSTGCYNLSGAQSADGYFNPLAAP